VVYTARNGFKDTVTGQTPPGVEMPLDGATVRLIPASGPAINASLDQNGNFNASLNPAQTYTAFAVLDSAKISVGPDTTASAPYQIPLGPVTQSAQRFVIGGGTGSTVTDPASGAANIFSTLQKGARVGSQAPVPIPKVNARWRYASDLTSWLGDRTPSQYDGTNQIYIGGQQAGAFRDEYERYPLLHEYAHHILDTAANPGPNSDGSHSFELVFPNRPALPWSEGFADAFAAIVTNTPQLTLGCAVRRNFAAEPATARGAPTDAMAPMPPAPNTHLAQYNETTIAGAVWGVAQHLGAGDSKAGFTPLIRALHSHPAQSMRDASDALAEDGAIETNPEIQEQIAKILRGQRINWYFDLQTGAGTGQTINSYTELQVKMTGAYSCQVVDEFADDSGLLPEDRGGGLFEIGGEGGLPYTWHDDCFGFSDGDPTTASPGGPDWFFVEYPYSGSSDPAGDDLHLSLRYTCTWPGTPDQCNASFNGYLIIRRGADPLGTGRLARYVTVDNVKLPRNTWVPIMDVDGMGNCTIVAAANLDCSI
jgi:hypothetical protein